MAGWLSAVVWRAPWFIDKWLAEHKFKWGVPLPHIMVVKIGDETVRGHVIFMGDKNILFYQYGDRMTRMLKRDDIKEMFQCDRQTTLDNVAQQTDCFPPGGGMPEFLEDPFAGVFNTGER